MRPSNWRLRAPGCSPAAARLWVARSARTDRPRRSARLRRPCAGVERAAAFHRARRELHAIRDEGCAWSSRNGEVSTRNWMPWASRCLATATACACGTRVKRRAAGDRCPARARPAAGASTPPASTRRSASSTPPDTSDGVRVGVAEEVDGAGPCRWPCSRAAATCRRASPRVRRHRARAAASVGRSRRRVPMRPARCRRVARTRPGSCARSGSRPGMPMRFAQREIAVGEAWRADPEHEARRRVVVLDEARVEPDRLRALRHESGDDAVLQRVAGFAQAFIAGIGGFAGDRDVVAGTWRRR